MNQECGSSEESELENAAVNAFFDGPLGSRPGLLAPRAELDLESKWPTLDSPALASHVLRSRVHAVRWTHGCLSLAGSGDDGDSSSLLAMDDIFSLSTPALWGWIATDIHLS